MDKYELGRSVALACGVLVGLVIAVFLMRYMNRNHKIRTEYDEMQKAIRSKGYMYGFYTMLIFEALLCLLPASLQIPAEPVVTHFLPIFLGITVLSSYCIWNGAYVGLNTNIKRYMIVALVAALINLLSFVLAWAGGGLTEDGVLQAPFVNLLCAVMFAVLSAAGLLRKSADRGETEE